VKIQNEKQLYFKWLHTEDQNYRIQLEAAEEKISEMVNKKKVINEIKNAMNKTCLGRKE
jgi:hypothetical protein